MSVCDIWIDIMIIIGLDLVFGAVLLSSSSLGWAEKYCFVIDETNGILEFPEPFLGGFDFFPLIEALIYFKLFFIFWPNPEER